MMPIGPLMIEHRLIERMIRIMSRELEKIKKDNKADTAFIDIAVDFIRTYADRCHHGKEEDILFRDLAKKKISDEHRKIMKELVEEHKMGRDNVKKLVEAKERYLGGSEASLKDIISNIETLAEFYPKHIEKEDKHFFIPCMGYFSDTEKNAMLDEMKEFDRNMIHGIYGDIVSRLEK